MPLGVANLSGIETFLRTHQGVRALTHITLQSIVHHWLLLMTGDGYANDISLTDTLSISQMAACDQQTQWV